MSLVVPLVAGIVTNVCFFMLSTLLRFSVAESILFIESGRKKIYVCVLYMIYTYSIFVYGIYTYSS